MTDSCVVIYQSWEQDGVFRPSVTGQCDCDCACAPVAPSMRRSSQIEETVPFCLHPELDLFPVEGEFEAAITPLSSGPVVLNERALALLGEFKSAKRLQDLPASWKREKAIGEFMTSLVALSILVPVDCPIAPPIQQNGHMLSTWLHVTNACNMSCDYCYVHRTNEHMSPEVGRTAIDAAFRAALANGYKGVQLKYAGGEPTLRFSFVLKLHRYAQSLSAHYGLTLDGVVLSNASLLSRSMIESMRRARLRLMVSMDNLDALSRDNQRVFLNGQGCRHKVALAIDELLELGLVPDVSVTITRRNLSGLPALVEWLLARELPFSLNYYRDNGRISSETALSLQGQEEEFIATMQKVFRVVRTNLPERSLLGSLVDHSNLAFPHLYPCGVGHNYLVIDHQGNVTKCQMDMQHPVTTVFAEDPLADVINDQAGLQNVPVLQKDTCSKCKWRYWCAGGCPLLTYRTTGRYDTHSPYCDIYKRLYPGVVQLEGLRLLNGGAGSEVVRFEVRNSGNCD